MAGWAGIKVALERLGSDIDSTPAGDWLLSQSFVADG
jgi:hypothetical protein